MYKNVVEKWDGKVGGGVTVSGIQQNRVDLTKFILYDGGQAMTA
jgi:hypothetical protein